VRWAVTGAGGMLGTEVAALLADRPGDGVLALARPDLDVTDAAAVGRALAGVDAVVHCAAWTAVDDAEHDEAAAHAVNAVGTANVAAACAATGARLVHVSTDYVFGGDRPGAWPEDAPAAPRSAYGRTKLAAEVAVRQALPEHWILRTAWLYGAHGPNFVRTMTARALAGTPSTVVDDQHGQPTWAADLARRAVEVVDHDVPHGTYHATSSGSTTWCGLAREVYRLAGADPRLVTPMPSTQLDRPAPRPANSVLGHDGWTAAGLPPLPPWQDSLRTAWPQIRG